MTGGPPKPKPLVVQQRLTVICSDGHRDRQAWVVALDYSSLLPVGERLRTGLVSRMPAHPDGTRTTWFPDDWDKTWRMTVTGSSVDADEISNEEALRRLTGVEAEPAVTLRLHCPICFMPWSRRLSDLERLVGPLVEAGMGEIEFKRLIRLDQQLS